MSVSLINVFFAVPDAMLFSNVHKSNVTLWLSCKNTAPPRPEALLYGLMQLQRKVKLEKFFGGVNRKEKKTEQ